MKKCINNLCTIVIITGILFINLLLLANRFNYFLSINISSARICYFALFIVICTAIIKSINKKVTKSNVAILIISILILMIGGLVINTLTNRNDLKNYSYCSPSKKNILILQEYEGFSSSRLNIYSYVNPLLYKKIDGPLLSEPNSKPLANNIARLKWLDDYSFVLYYQHTKNGGIVSYTYYLSK